MKIKAIALLFCIILVSGSQARAELLADDSWFAPCSIVLSSESNLLYIGSERTKRIVVWDTNSKQAVREFMAPGSITGMALSKGPKFLWATEMNGCFDYITRFELKSAKQTSRRFSFRGLCSPVVCSTKNRLFACCRYSNEILEFELSTLKLLRAIPVEREPIAMALTPDDQRLWISHHLPSGPANASIVASSVSVVDATTFQVLTNISLPNGSTSLNGIAISPDGVWACVTHNFARFKVPAIQVQQGWMNDSAISLFDVKRMMPVATLLLDDSLKGAANPWAANWSGDSELLCITHSGTHELSVINFASLKTNLTSFTHGTLVDDLTFVKPYRHRVSLGGNGPRSLVVDKRKAWVAEYFSDSLSEIDCSKPALIEHYRLNTQSQTNDPVRWGEQLFFDATLANQNWQSCASCHPDARMDGLNWDLPNDGIGNPKSTKSLLLSHKTPPAMSLGIRETAETAVRAGLRGILFAVRPEKEAEAIDTYLKSLQPLPSPWLVSGRLSSSASRGKNIFNKLGCVSCHPPPLYTNLKAYDIGTGTGKEIHALFDTPTLVECWRTSPYLHDGSAKNIQDALTKHKLDDLNGGVGKLTSKQLQDLIAFVLSL